MLPRSIVIFMLLATTLSLAPSAVADAAFTDPTGDVTAQPAGTAIPDNAQVQATDLVGLDAVEGDHDWTFILKVAGFGQQGGTINAYTTALTWNDATYRISIFRSRVDPTSTPLIRGQLQLADGAAFNKIIDLAVVEQANTLTVHFEKLYIASLEGHAPVPGSELTDIMVTSRGDLNFGNAAPVQLIDTLVANAPIVYTKGGTSTGHIVLEPTDPVRISNGGSGTFVYTVHVQNRGTVEDTVEMRISDLPAGWTARVHPQYAVPPQDEVPIVLIATLPFGHTHGGFSALTLTATSLRDPAVTATTRLGVVHTPIPQPAGHHSELYLHATPSDSGVFQTASPGTINTMNTLSDHAGDEAEAYPNNGFQGPGNPMTNDLVWPINLGPQLAMGLDFDISRTGSITGTLMGRTTGAAELTAELWLIHGDTDVTLLATAPLVGVTLDLQNPTPFAFTLTPTAESDFIAYGPGQNIQLRLALTTETPCCGPKSDPTLLVADFAMTLPLNEYHEAPVINEEGGEIIATLESTPVGPIEKRARPGTTMTYAFDVKNAGAAALDVRIEVEGTAKTHATVAPGLSFALAPGAIQRVLVGMTIPSDANDGEVLDALLILRSASDPANLAIARTSTVVSRGVDSSPDESDVLAAALGVTKETPLGGTGLLILAAVAVALARRR